jgi:hypothetical protein
MANVPSMESLTARIGSDFPELKPLANDRYSIHSIPTDDKLRELLELLSLEGASLSVYDSKYPSPSDPGAYLDFFTRGRSDLTWRMTLGNHGWSGGAYSFPIRTLIEYLVSTFVDGSVRDIEIGDGGFKHYKDVDSSKSEEMLSRLRAIHIS